VWDEASVRTRQEALLRALWNSTQESELNHDHRRRTQRSERRNQASWIALSCSILYRLRGTIGGGYSGPFVDDLIKNAIARTKKAEVERDAAIATIKKFQEYIVQLIKDTPIKYSKDGSFPEPLCAILAWSENK
jgi:hypothetical protein